MKETMHFNSFQEMLNFVNHRHSAEELPEYKEKKKERKKVDSDVGQDDRSDQYATDLQPSGD